MKYEIEIPEEVLEPMQKVCEGFKLPMERALAIIACDWIARQDAEMATFKNPATPGYQCFDHQFNEYTPLGYEIESSYESSRVNWQNEFQNHSEFYQQRATDLERTDAEAMQGSPGLVTPGRDVDYDPQGKPCVHCGEPATQFRKYAPNDGPPIFLDVCDEHAKAYGE